EKLLALHRRTAQFSRSFLFASPLNYVEIVAISYHLQLEELMPDTITLGPIGQIAFSTDILDQQVTFYRDTLGVPFLFQVPGMAFFDLGGVRLMFSDIQEGERHPASTLYFRVS